MRRRSLLAAAAGLVGSGALPGCLDEGPVDTPTATPGRPSPSPTGHLVTPSDLSFDVLDRTCASDRNAATVRVEGETVGIDGVIGGRDTCDTARLASAVIADGVLSVVVEVIEEPTTGTTGCAQCLTAIEYAFAATVPDRPPTSVRVIHRTADGASVVATADRP